MLDVGFFETHRVYRKPGPKEDPRFCLPPAPIPDTEETRADIAAFKASARVMDEGVGLVLKALETAGLADNTLVISTTDHGIAFPAMKCNLTDHGMGVSPIMRGPVCLRAGRFAPVISQIDLFPTLCDLISIEHPAWLQGKLLLPLMSGAAVEIHDEVFSEVNYHAAYEPKRAVRTKRWKYIRRFDHRIHPTCPIATTGRASRYGSATGWRDRLVDAEQMFDLYSIPTRRAISPGIPRSAPLSTRCADGSTAGCAPRMTRFCVVRFLRLRARPRTIGRYIAPGKAKTLMNVIDMHRPHQLSGRGNEE